VGSGASDSATRCRCLAKNVCELDEADRRRLVSAADGWFRRLPAAGANPPDRRLWAAQHLSRPTGIWVTDRQISSRLAGTRLTSERRFRSVALAHCCTCAVFALDRTDPKSKCQSGMPAHRRPAQMVRSKNARNFGLLC
jgi:hypothetical protein